MLAGSAVKSLKRRFNSVKLGQIADRFWQRGEVIALQIEFDE